MASDQSLNHAYDTTGKTIVPIRADLAVTDPEFINLRAMCASEEVVCAAVSCENRKLEVRAKGSRRNADGSISQVRAHYRHVGRNNHGASERASASESMAHVAAKYRLCALGASFGHSVEVEVLTKDDQTGVIRKPDVVWTPSDGSAPWAVEAQFSPIDTLKWKRRTDDLIKLGYRPLWFWGNVPRTLHGDEEFVYDVFGWRDKYDKPADVWVVEIAFDVDEIDWERATVAQCYSRELAWERHRAASRRRPPWPNSITYSRAYEIERCNERGVKCPELDEMIADGEAEAAQSHSGSSIPGQGSFGAKYEYDPTVIAEYVNGDEDPEPPKPTKKRKEGQCACGAGCENHPEPDPLGRYRCTDCMCFTADPGRRHGWCRAGSIKKWSDEIAMATKR